MSIHIQGLKVSKVERQIRELISTPQGAIEIYEPTTEDIANIVDLQRDNQGFGEETGVVSFDGVTVIRELFPILTNINLGNLSDEELEDVINNPSVHLLIAQQYVAQIVTETNKLYAQRVKTEIMQAESTMAQVELMNAIPNMILDKAKRDGRVIELSEKVEEASKALKEAMESEQRSENTETEVVSDVEKI